MKFIVTIDTEEDNWARYSATKNSVENIEKIPVLQNIFDDFKITPTYLISYPVADNMKSVEILRRILENGKCEIGMHCHPWNTPPLDVEDRITKRDTMLCNLPENLQHEKLITLHEVIKKNFGFTPVSFRAGRFGFGQAVANSLCRLGYRIDTSVTPFVDWRKDQGPDFTDFDPLPFRFTSRGLNHKDKSGPLLEIPITIGFLQRYFKLCRNVTRYLSRAIAQKLHIQGILWYLNVLNKVWLSPEQSNSDMMIKIAKRMRKNKYNILNLTFHSTSLLCGLGPFVKTQEDEYKFIENITVFLKFIQNEGYQSVTLSELNE